jgi:hypothetical protein
MVLNQGLWQCKLCGSWISYSLANFFAYRERKKRGRAEEEAATHAKKARR